MAVSLDTCTVLARFGLRKIPANGYPRILLGEAACSKCGPRLLVSDYLSVTLSVYIMFSPLNDNMERTAT
jgi:hypothetical protein